MHFQSCFNKETAPIIFFLPSGVFAFIVHLNSRFIFFSGSQPATSFCCLKSKMERKEKLLVVTTERGAARRNSLLLPPEALLRRRRLKTNLLLRRRDDGKAAAWRGFPLPPLCVFPLGIRDVPEGAAAEWEGCVALQNK